MEVEDVFRNEGLGSYDPIVFSPDGSRFLLIWRPPIDPNATAGPDDLFRFRRLELGSELWCHVIDRSEKPSLLVDQEAAGFGLYLPTWSPNGRQIAFLSARDGNCFLWRKRADGSLERLTHRAVLITNNRHSYEWLDDSRIVCPLMPEGRVPAYIDYGMSAQVVAPMAAWRKSLRNEGSTVSVLDSGSPRTGDEAAQGRLVLIDVATGHTTVLSDATVGDWWPAPDKKLIAVTRVVAPRQLDQVDTIRADVRREALEVRSLSGELVFGVRPEMMDVLPQSVSWAGRSQHLVFQGGSDRNRQLIRLHTGTGTMEILRAGDLAGDVWQFDNELVVGPEGEVVVFAAAGPASAAGTARKDWWLLSAGSAPRNLTAHLPAAVPARLHRIAGGSATVGVADGKLWQLSFSGVEARFQPIELGTEISEIVWPWPRLAAPFGTAQHIQPASVHEKILLRKSSRGADDLICWNPADGSTHPLKRPDFPARLLAFNPESETAIFCQEGDDGLIVASSSARTGAVHLVRTGNAHLARIKGGTYSSFEYVSSDGEKLRAGLLLPPGAGPQDRLPLVVWVYPGRLAGTSLAPSDSISANGFLNKQILAARGYVVLMPSIPMRPPPGGRGDAMLQLAPNVLPAIDAAITLGGIDPQRVFLMGYSFGGFATYGLISQTQRFRAAIAIAGFSNLVSFYGTFDSFTRYTAEAHWSVTAPGYLETHVLLQRPPWEEVGRYFRNSPINFVDRVETPLMIIHGDLDYCPLQQGEEMFAALQRRGKRVKFVRYWGEGHILCTPKNIRDAWQQIFDWLKENDRKPAAGPGK